MAHAAGSAASNDPDTASAAASASMGRRRLPPANTLYRMASLTIGGHAGGRGRNCSRARSTSARPLEIKSMKAGNVEGPDPPGTPLVIVRQRAGERRWRRLELAALAEDLDAPLRFLEPRVAEARQLHAAFVEHQRLLERQVAVLELLHGRLELGDRGFKVLD